MEIVDSIPLYVWFIAGFLILLMLGDRKLWDYEAKFPLNPGVGRGEIEIECFKKRGPVIAAKMRLEPACNGKPLEVFLGNEQVLTVPAEKNRGAFFIFRAPYKYPEPVEGSVVEVRLNGRAIFSGPLILD